MDKCLLRSILCQLRVTTKTVDDIDHTLGMAVDQLTKCIPVTVLSLYDQVFNFVHAGGRHSNIPFFIFPLPICKRNSICFYSEEALSRLAGIPISREFHELTRIFMIKFAQVSVIRG